MTEEQENILPGEGQGDSLDFSHINSALETAQVEELEREGRRAAMMSQIAHYRSLIARKYHRLDSGEPLNFDDYPFQREIYEDNAMYLVIMGSVQWGKSEFLICNSAAMAACGLKVFYVIDKYEKRDKFVASRISPAFHQVPFYKGMIKSARKLNNNADSQRFKHFGPGSINFVGSNSVKDFSTYSADAAQIDEHQLCVQENISKVFNRMSGSPWRFTVVVGNPRAIGTAENRNLDYEYQQTDQRQWNIPCPFCGMFQVLGWWSHFVLEEKNKAGAVIRISPRDPQWTEGSMVDIRPVCTNCRQPMNRLSRDGKWVPRRPGVVRHGYQLSNLYNKNVRIDELYPRYIDALLNPNLLGDFVNDQLGLAWNLEGSSITDRLLAQASTGELCGLSPYAFLHPSELRIPELAAA